MQHATGDFPEFDEEAIIELFAPFNDSTGLADEFFDLEKYKTTVGQGSFLAVDYH